MNNCSLLRYMTYSYNTVRNTFLRKLFQPWNAEKLNCLCIIYQIRGLNTSLAGAVASLARTGNTCKYFRSPEIQYFGSLVNRKFGNSKHRKIGGSEKRKFRKSESQKERVSSTFEPWNPEVHYFESLEIRNIGKSEDRKNANSGNRKSERKGILKE